jgi:hypothetical protein
LDSAKGVDWDWRRTITITPTTTATLRKIAGITVIPRTRLKRAVRITMHTRVGTRTRTRDRRV